MDKYFKTTEITHLIDGVYTPLNIVTNIAYSENEIDGFIKVEEEYRKMKILGMAYDFTNKTFFDFEVDEDTHLPSQLDRIEHGTTQLLSDIKASTIDEYTLELMKEGII